MTMMSCQECGNQVSSDAAVCMNCGVKPKPPKKKGSAIVGLLTTMVIIGFAIKACDSSESNVTKSQTAAERQTQELIWIEKGKDAAREKLRDPGSAVFKQTVFHRGKLGTPVTCGQVNSKNGMGGFTGFQRFVSASTPEMTFLEEQVSDFPVLWKKLCID